MRYFRKEKSLGRRNGLFHEFQSACEITGVRLGVITAVSAHVVDPRHYRENDFPLLLDCERHETEINDDRSEKIQNKNLKSQL